MSSPQELLADLAKLSNRAGYVWINRRWPGDERAIALACNLAAACRPPRRPGKLTPQERLERAQAAAGKLALALAALATCPALDAGQAAEIREISGELQAAARTPRPAS